MSCVLAQTIVGLSNREAIVLFTFATVKQVDDHSGYCLPWSPFAIYGRLTGASGVYHGIHHQRWGMKVPITLSSFLLSYVICDPLSRERQKWALANILLNFRAIWRTTLLFGTI